MKRPRKPTWYESNLIAREGIPDQENWKVLSSNQEYMRIRNQKTGAVREIDRGGKVIPRESIDLSESLAREMRCRREAE